MTPPTKHEANAHHSTPHEINLHNSTTVYVTPSVNTHTSPIQYNLHDILYNLHEPTRKETP